MPNETPATQAQFDHYLDLFKEIGFIEKVTHPIVYVNGLPTARPDEVVIFENGEFGQVLSLNENMSEILVFSQQPLQDGYRVARTNRTMEVSLSTDLFGKIIDPLEQTTANLGSDEKSYLKKPIDTYSFDLLTRKKIARPLISGVSVVDLLIPLGKGQRELIIGDRKTGKTNFILQTILTQVKEGAVCIYTAIGKRIDEIRKVEVFLRNQNIRDKVIIIGSSAFDPVGKIYLTPYIAMTVAEHFRDQGRDVFLVLDDLTTHAKFYREVSLLAGRFPGRASYPADVFYAHARLLERAGNFVTREGKEVSITCFPVAETVEGNISGYIQTNLMSITDGHIYFDYDLFSKARRPAVNYFLSVTRVGRQTQSIVRWGINRELNTFLAFLDKTESFVHFGAELNEGITTLVSMGEKIISFFNQHMETVVPVNMQVLLFSLIWVGTWQDVDKAEMNTDLQYLIKKYDSDRSFAQKVDGLVTEAKDFNNLLGTLSKSGKELIEKAKHA